MAALDHGRHTANDTFLGGSIGSAVATILGRVTAWNDARVTRNALSKLTDRELDDIGLCRGDIDDIR